jgi:hypothetical protein
VAADNGGRLQLPAGTATAGTEPLKFIAGTPTTTPETGAIGFNTGLWIADSSTSHRDTIAMRNWVRNNPIGGISNYSHTIFTPLTGATVNLINKQYNIINPAGAILALTVNLPSTPSNNDVVYIKYTQTVTTVTYGNGTVVDGITSPVAGDLVVLTYDSGTTSWY